MNNPSTVTFMKRISFPAFLSLGLICSVSVFAQSGWTTFKTSDGLPDNEVTALSIGAGGNLWCGTANGVSVFDGDAWTVVPTMFSMWKPYIRSIASGPDGYVWFSSYGETIDGQISDKRISRLDGNTVITFMTSQGLPDDIATAIQW